MVPAGADRLWLVGVSEDFTDVATAVGRLLDYLDIQDHNRFLAVTPDFKRWGYVIDHIEDTDPDCCEDTDYLLPQTARLAALSIHASCTRHLDAVSLLEPAEGDVEEHAALQGKLAQLRHLIVGGPSLEYIDRCSLIGCLDSPGPITQAEAVNLGLALTESRLLVDLAVERILTAENAGQVRLDLWCRITSATSGQARATAAALAALAAWRTGDPIAGPACEAAIEADPTLGLARQVDDLLASGIGPEAIGAAFPDATKDDAIKGDGAEDGEEEA
ncbi:hypothetical protein GCM10029992_36530 [Glycomyces albus]